MANILVTGSNGQLGSEIKSIKDNYPQHSFFFTDIEELDLTKKQYVEEFISSNSINTCVNCAAYTAVDKAEDDRELAMLVNSEAVKILAQACNKNQVRLIHISTDYVFDGSNYKPYAETDEPSPNSYYGITKLAGEKSVSQNIDNHVIIRTSWLYSNYGNNFVKTMIRLGNERDNLGVVVDQIGTPTFAADLAIGIMACIESDKTGIYHYSNLGVISWYDFAKAIMQLNNIECRVNAIESKDFPAKAPRPFYSVLNKAKFINDFEVEIPYWLDSLKLMISRIKN
ncbi:MAG: dTDP-4-dehydrorhamnose reductase [Marinilabiliales bacterium]|nr:MAG: dTDP-4-dehydrorhamnose reductase [Marinilabiliales bacterium]